MVFDNIKQYFQLFPAHLMVKTLNHGRLTENLLGLAKWMSFDGF